MFSKLFPGVEDEIDDRVADDDLYGSLKDFDDESEERTTKSPKPVNPAKKAETPPKRKEGTSMDYTSLRARNGSTADGEKKPKTPDPVRSVEELLGDLGSGISETSNAKPTPTKAESTPAAGSEPPKSRPKGSSAFARPRNLDEPDFLAQDELKKLNRTLERLTTKLETQDAKLTQLESAISGMTRTVSGLTSAVSKITPANPTDLTPVLEAIKALKPAGSPVEPDLTPLRDQMADIQESVKTVLNRLAQRPTATGGGTTFEEVVERNLELGEFRKSLEGFVFRRGYSLNGEFKDPAEVAKFFGTADPRGHGLTELVAKFDEKGHFIEWSDELHLRAYELYGSTPAAPKKPASSKTSSESASKDAKKADA